MKTRLLWTLILAVGSIALYCGIVRPEVSTIPSEVRDSMDDLKPPQLPPLEPPALYFGITRPHVSSIPANLRDSIDELKPVVPTIEPPALVIPELPALTIPALPPIAPVSRSEPIPSRPEIPIQNQATIDFSTGAPVVRTHGKDQDAIESALKEMSEVLKDAKIEVKK